MELSQSVSSHPSRSHDKVRAHAVAALGLMDTEPEFEFDEVAALAAEICGTPVSLITLLDDQRQFNKARFGIGTSSVPLDQSFCRFTVQGSGIFIVSDASTDPRFRNNPFVLHDPCIRFYAGFPLQDVDGISVGALCVIDLQPRSLSETQARALTVLGRQVSLQLRLRARTAAMQALAADLDGERELFRSFLDIMPIEACLKAADGSLLFYNRRISERFGLRDGEWIGKTGHELWPLHEAEIIRAEEEHILRNNRPHESYIEQDTPNGGKSFWKIVQTPLRRSSGEVLLANIGIDLTQEMRREESLQKNQDELEEANRKLRSLALTDDLTHLWNRRAFDARLETEVFRAHSTGNPLALLMIDVDDFKQINDEHGHPAGDQVLTQLAAALRRIAQEHHMAARFGGEEFAVILPSASLEVARSLCHRLSAELKSAPWAHRQVTVSIGIATCLPTSSADDLLDMADEAMYRAKRNGKSCAVAYEVVEPTPAAAVG